MITKKDRVLLIDDLKEVFATKDEIGTIIDAKLKPIHKKIDTMQKSLNTTISYFDTVTTKHDRRLKRVESHLNLPVLAD